jgi:hypothetical protein
MLTRLALADDTHLAPLLARVLYAITSLSSSAAPVGKLIRTSYRLSVIEIFDAMLKFLLAGLWVPCSDCFYYLLEGKIASVCCFFFFNIDTHTRTITHPYEYMHGHSIHMSTSERLSRLDLEIHEVGHQERLAVDENVASHWKNN